MTDRPAIGLAHWLLRHAEGPVTHLKLQKLCFYGYGAALAFGFESELGGPIRFRAWQHGPVSPEVWRAYRDSGSAPLPEPDRWPAYSETTRSHLADVVSVYGRLSPWQLRQQSHLERPWREAFDPDAPRAGAVIAADTIRAHFVEKYVADTTVPEYLGRGSSFVLDGLPVARFENLHALANALRNA